MKTKTSLILFIAIMLNFGNSIAQSVTQGYPSTWFTVLNRIKFAKHWSFSNELHERTGKFFDVQGQFLERPSIDYLMNKNVEFSVGYSFIHVSPYAPYSNPIKKVENNIWEQVVLKNDLGKVHLLHRFRQEHRWVNNVISEKGEYRISGNNYSNRFRYRINASFDIVKFKEGDKSFFFNAFNEIWFSQNAKIIPTDFARNWFYVGFGYKFNKNTNIQLGYMHQYDKVGANKFISTPIMQMTFVKNFDFSKSE